MTEEQQKQTVLDYIKTQSLGVLATVNAKGLPEAATLSISQTDQLELIFQTPNSTRKYTNLQTNPHVAVVFGWSREDYITVQYEGVARQVTDADERTRIAAIHVAANPSSKPYADLPDNKFFIVSPTQIRYSEVKNDLVFT